MNDTVLGTYYFKRVEGGTQAHCVFTCPFCSLDYPATLAASKVMARPTIVTTECHRCSLVNNYAPKTNPGRARSQK